MTPKEARGIAIDWAYTWPLPGDYPATSHGYTFLSIQDIRITPTGFNVQFHTVTDAEGESMFVWWEYVETTKEWREPAKSPLHACYAPQARIESNGAIDYCSEYGSESGFFQVGNGEYSSYVNFCPFCGQKAPHPIPVKPA